MYVNSKERRAQNGQAASVPSNNLQAPATSTLPATPLTRSLSPPTPTPNLLAFLQRDGYVCIPGLLNQNEISTLLSACASVTALASSGSWPHIRTVPKQFPPWPSTPTSAGIWGVQHLLHPSIPYRSTFVSAYFHPTVLAHVCALLSAPGPSSLVMELFNLLVSPTSGDSFSLTWHRDDVRPDLSPEAEAADLAAKSPAGKQLHAQYNIALTPDDSLVVIPGSHRRPRTEDERNADPRAEHLPGQVVVRLKPGDAVFYDSNILHRGVYQPTKKSTSKLKEREKPSSSSSSNSGTNGTGEGVDNDDEHCKDDGNIDLNEETATATITAAGNRYTLHGSVGLVGHGAERARQVLQHGVGEWVEREDAGFRGLGLTAVDDEEVKAGLGGQEIEDLAEGMRERLVEMGRSRGEGEGEGGEFSLEG